MNRIIIGIANLLLFILFPIMLLAAPQAVQIESSISGYLNTDGTALANGTIELFTSDSLSSYKAVYSDAQKTSQLSQPIILNDAGQPTDALGNTIALFGEGVYWVRLKDSDGNVVKTYQSLSYEGRVDFGGLYIDMAGSYGRTDTAFTNALTDYASGHEVTFLFNGLEFVNTTARTIPAHIKLLFVNGAYLTNSGILNYDGQLTLEKNSYISNSSTLTISGNITFEDGSYIGNTGSFVAGNLKIQSPLQYIFKGVGSYTGNIYNNIIFAEWFGAVGDGTTDDYSALSKSIEFIDNGNSSTLKLLENKTYLSNSSISTGISNNVNIISDGMATIKAGGTNHAYLLSFSGCDGSIFLKNITFDGDNKVCRGIYIDSRQLTSSNTPSFTAENIIIKNVYEDSAVDIIGVGMFIRGLWNDIRIDRCTIENVDSKDLTPNVVGLYIDKSYDVDNFVKNVSITDSTFRNIANSAISGVVDCDGLSVFSGQNASDTTQVSIMGNYFENCEGRSIKTQTRTSIITGNKFRRDKYTSSTPEVESQFGGTVIANNSFYYKGYSAAAIMASEVRNNYTGNLSNITIVNNNVIADSVTLSQVVQITEASTSGLLPLNGVIINGNQVTGTANYMLNLRIPALNNFVAINNNYVLSLSSGYFGYLWNKSGSTPVLNCQFTGNATGSGVNAWYTTQNTTVVFKEFDGNYNITNNITNTAEFSQVYYSGTVSPDATLTVNIPAEYFRQVQKVKCATGYTEAAGGNLWKSVRESYIIRNQGTFAVGDANIETIDLVANYDPEIGTWNVSCTTGNIIISKTAGSLSGTIINYWISLEGIGL